MNWHQRQVKQRHSAIKTRREQTRKWQGPGRQNRFPTCRCICWKQLLSWKDCITCVIACFIDKGIVGTLCFLFWILPVQWYASKDYRFADVALKRTRKLIVFKLQYRGCGQHTSTVSSQWEYSGAAAGEQHGCKTRWCVYRVCVCVCVCVCVGLEGERYLSAVPIDRVWPQDSWFLAVQWLQTQQTNHKKDSKHLSFEATPIPIPICYRSKFANGSSHAILWQNRQNFRSCSLRSYTYVKCVHPSKVTWKY